MWEVLGVRSAWYMEPEAGILKHCHCKVLQFASNFYVMCCEIEFGGMTPDVLPVSQSRMRKIWHIAANMTVWFKMTQLKDYAAKCMLIACVVHFKVLKD
jgi:hypothetical protein